MNIISTESIAHKQSGVPLTFRIAMNLSWEQLRESLGCFLFDWTRNVNYLITCVDRFHGYFLITIIPCNMKVKARVNKGNDYIVIKRPKVD